MPKRLETALARVIAFRGEAIYRTELAADALSQEILQERAYGLRNEHIARKLFISEATVKSHVHRILQKFGCEDRTQLVVTALRMGMVK